MTTNNVHIGTFGLNNLIPTPSSLNGSHGEWTESDDVERKNWNDPHKRKITLPREKNTTAGPSQVDRALSQLAACGLTGETPPERAPRPEGVRAPKTARQKPQAVVKTLVAKSTEAKKAPVAEVKIPAGKLDLSLPPTATPQPSKPPKKNSLTKYNSKETVPREYNPMVYCGEVPTYFYEPAVDGNGEAHLTRMKAVGALKAHHRNQIRNNKRKEAKDAEHQAFMSRVAAANRLGVIRKLERFFSKPRRAHPVVGVLDQFDVDGVRTLDHRYVTNDFMRRVHENSLFDTPLLAEGEQFTFNCRVRHEPRIRIDWSDIAGLLASCTVTTVIARNRANAVREIWEAKQASIPDGTSVGAFLERMVSHGIGRAIQGERKFVGEPFVGRLNKRAIMEFEERLMRLYYTKRCRVVIIYIRDPMNDTLWKKMQKWFWRGFARRVKHEYNPLLHEHGTEESHRWMGSVIFQEDYLMQNKFTRERHTLADPDLYKEVSKFACGLNVGDHTMLRYLYTKFIRQGSSQLPLDIQQDTILKAYQDLIYRASRDKLSCIQTVAAPPDGKT